MKLFRKVPFLLLLLPLMAGIIVWRYVAPVSFYGAAPAYMDEERYFLLQVTSVPREFNRTIRFEGVVQPIPDSLCSRYDDTHSRTLCTLERDFSALLITQGDRLVVHTALRHSNRGNPDEFDYDEWLALRGIASVCYVRADEWKPIGHTDLHSLVATAERLQHRLSGLLQEAGIQGDDLGVLAALTLGDKFYLSADTRRQWAAAGASHVLAVSGLHTGIVYGAVLMLLTVFGLYPVQYGQRWRRWMNAVLIVLCLWVYAFLTGLSPSVVRASLMFSLFAVGAALNRDTNTYNIIFAAAFLTLVFSPRSLFSVSFQLSYAAVLSIVFFYKQLSPLCHSRFKLLRWVWDLFIISVAAQIGTLPFTLYYFSQTANFFALTNFFIIPAAQLMLYTAILYFPLAGTLVGSWVGWGLRGEVGIVNRVMGEIESWPYATANVGITFPVAAGLVCVALLVAVWLEHRRWQWLFPLAATLLSVVALQSCHLYHIAHTQEMVIYNTSRYNLVFVQNGRQCMLLTDSAEAALRVSEPHRKKQMLNEPEVIDISGKDMFSFNYKGRNYLWLLGDAFKDRTLMQNADCDVLLLSYLPPWQHFQIEHIHRTETILMPALPSWQRQAWQKVREWQ